MRFRYRLDGFDSHWIDAGTRRQAYYMNLEPRRYRFIVQAADSDGRWIETDTSWTFAIQPSFYQTLWFRMACLLALAIGVWSTWQLLLRHIRRQFAMVLAERARLSREIHDTVLQNLAGVAIHCAGIANTLEPLSPARGQIDLVRTELEEQLREVRQAVWDLRSPILEANALPDALREVARRAINGTTVRFELLVSGTERQLTPRVENEVLRIGQEAVTNAVRHAGASRVLLELRFESRALVLRISDDGSGFHAEHVNELDGHFGLIGMRERAAQLGGILKIDALPAGGTEVELVVPAALRLAES
jgi:signal transduction histidine kinase